MRTSVLFCCAVLVRCGLAERGRGRAGTVGSSSQWSAPLLSLAHSSPPLTRDDDLPSRSPCVCPDSRVRDRSIGACDCLSVCLRRPRIAVGLGLRARRSRNLALKNIFFLLFFLLSLCWFIVRRRYERAWMARCDVIVRFCAAGGRRVSVSVRGAAVGAAATAVAHCLRRRPPRGRTMPMQCTFIAPHCHCTAMIDTGAHTWLTRMCVLPSDA